jgi:hypothetical protein
MVQICDRFLQFKHEKIKVNIKIITLKMLQTYCNVIMWIVMQTEL